MYYFYSEFKLLLIISQLSVSKDPKNCHEQRPSAPRSASDYWIGGSVNSQVRNGSGHSYHVSSCRFVTHPGDAGWAGGQLPEQVIAGHDLYLLLIRSRSVSIKRQFAHVMFALHVQRSFLIKKISFQGLKLALQ
jgi:hypothetical protein